MQYFIPFWFAIPVDSSMLFIQKHINQDLCQNPKSNLTHNSSFDKQKWQKYLDIFTVYLEKKSKKLAKKQWTKKEDELLFILYEQGKNWEQISKFIQYSNEKICKRRYDRLKEGLQKWPKQLDQMIKSLSQYQEPNWSKIHAIIYSNKQKRFPKHTIKQVKQRYLLSLRPGITAQEWTVQQDITLLNMIHQRGTHWRKLYEIFPGRTQLQLKNRFYGKLKPLQKKVLRKLSQCMKQTNEQQNVL